MYNMYTNICTCIPTCIPIVNSHNVLYVQSINVLLLILMPHVDYLSHLDSSLNFDAFLMQTLTRERTLPDLGL